MSINSDVALKRWKPAKNHERQRCGDNLYVRGFLTGRKLFQMRFANDPWIDIGDYPDRSLAQAREITITAKRIYKARAASLEQIKKAALLSNTATDFEASLIGTKVNTVERTGIPTFDEMFRQWYQLQLKANRWTHKSSIAKPIRSYEMHLEAALGNLRVDKITRIDLKNLLQPLYLSNRDLGPALRGYIDEVLEEAVDAELIGYNPCPPHKRFAKPQAKVKHAPSLHFEQLPDIWKWIEQAQFSFTVKVAMKTVVITAHRASVIAFARWDHIDLKTGKWAIPERPEGAKNVGFMKSGRAFAMQLPNGLLNEFRSLNQSNEAKPSEFVFAMNGGKPMNAETLRRNFQKYGDVSSHGFRNSFKTWALHEDIDQFLVDRYVDHSLVGLDRAYRRDDLYSQRAELAEKYYSFVAGAA